MESLFISKNQPLWLVLWSRVTYTKETWEHLIMSTWSVCWGLHKNTVNPSEAQRQEPASFITLITLCWFSQILQNHNISQQYSWKTSPIGAPESSAVLWRINNACDITSPVSRVKHYWRGRFIRRCLTLLINKALTSFRRSAGNVSLSEGGANLLNSTNHTLQTPSVLLHYRLYYIIKQLLARVWKITSTTTA